MKFKELYLSGSTTAALDEMSYIDATEVQEKAIPLVLQGEDVIVRSQTGTGKTAAFGIGLIEIISKDKDKKALILAPTRELALQITKEIRSIAKNHRMRIYAIYGGQDINAQYRLLERGAEMVVATPGRLLDHVRRGSLKLEEFNLIVLDEADRMLDMGFREDIDIILNGVNKKRQMMLFSATIGRDIERMTHKYMVSPNIIEVGAEGKVEAIDEELIHLSRSEKLRKLKEILKSEPVSRTLVFVATKRSAEYVCDKLNMDGIEAHYLHGGKSQNQRERTLRGFKEGTFRILVATDVAARGLHIEDISHVINYDQANSTDDYTHRVGRTGRMGKKGKAITFIETDAVPRTGGYGRGGPRRDYGSRPQRGSGSYGTGSRDHGTGSHSSHGTSSHGHGSSSQETGQHGTGGYFTHRVRRGYRK